MTASTIKLSPGFTLLINSTSLQDAVHSDRQQLCFTLPAHEYGYIHYTSYYTDTMGTSYIGINFYVRLAKEKKKKKGWLYNPVASSILGTESRCPLEAAALPSQVQMQSFRSEFYIRTACAGGFIMSSVHNQILHIDAHTHIHTSLSSARKHPCILPLRTEWVAKQRRLSLASVVKSHLCCCGVCSRGDGAECVGEHKLSEKALESPRTGLTFVPVTSSTTETSDPERADPQTTCWDRSSIFSPSFQLSDGVPPSSPHVLQSDRSPDVDVQKHAVTEVPI